MIRKTTFTILLITTISLALAQNVAREQIGTQTKSKKSSTIVSKDSKAVKLDAILVPAGRENSKQNKQPVAIIVPARTSDKTVAKKQTRTTTK